jgi:transposase
MLPPPRRRRDNRGRPWASNWACFEGILWILQTGAAWRSPHEATLAEATLQEVSVPRPKGRPRQKPERVIADTAYDSDPLRQRLQKRGIELIAPYQENNRQRRYEDGRKLHRYKRRWIVERTNSWLGQFRRLLVRHEHLLSTYRAFFYLGCFWITLRHCL